MTTALLFGFLGLFIPFYNFERLHIFLFNLSSGGTIILMYTEKKKTFTVKTGAFYILSLLYAACAFFSLYQYAICLALIMAFIAENIRSNRFSFFPADFFKRSVTFYSKFHQASLLCLSIGLIISSLVICNHQYWKILSSPKLTLDIFFLGFSFPVSLITMSVMFIMMEEDRKITARILKEFSFWAVNIGVIVFFLFILLQMIMAELVISFSLFITVVIIFFLFLRTGIHQQAKAFLTSGMIFLIMTAVTGILYILLYIFTPQPHGDKFLLKLHALISLYGWNLTGLAVICRYDDFPIKLNSGKIILFHWIIVLFLAPLGFYFRALSVTAVIAYGLFLSFILFSKD